MNRSVALKAPLRIALFGFSERNESMMRQLFAGARWRDCLVVEQSPIDFAIVELDTQNPTKTWGDFREIFPDTLALTLSLKEQHLANTVFVQKPLNMEKLRHSVDKVIAYLNETSAVTSQSNGVLEDSLAQTAQTAADSMGDELDNQLFGLTVEIDLNNTEARLERAYNPGDYFLGELKKAVEAAEKSGKALEIAGSLYGEPWPGAIRINPATHTIETNLRDIMLRAMSIVRLDSGQFTLEVKHSMVPLSGATTISTKALVWKVALWTARGRLTTYIGFERKISLKNWPNVTRYMEVPYVLQLSAALVANSYTPVELCQKLNIPQRFVFSYLSAVNANGLLNLDAEMVSSTNHQGKRPLRRFLNKILERLTTDAAS